MNYINQLTSLRFVLAFWVLLHHYSVRNTNFEYSIISFGYVAVDFFFVLSGFVIARSYSYRHGFKFSTFIKKRFARVYPLHILFLVLYVLLYFFAELYIGGVKHPEKYNFESIWSNVFLVHAWGFENNLYFNFPSWSVSSEWFAYCFIFPLWIALSKRGLLFCFLMSILIILLCNFLTLILLNRELTRLTFDYSILRIIPEFFVGCFSYYSLFFLGGFGQRFLKLLCFFSLLSISYILSLDVNWHFLIIFFIGVFISSFSCINSGLVNSFFTNRYFVILGESSYSLYMMHMFFYSVYFNGLDFIFGSSDWTMIFWYVGVLLVVLFSVVLHRYLEIPLSKLLYKVIK